MKAVEKTIKVCGIHDGEFASMTFRFDWESGNNPSQRTVKAAPVL